MMNWFDKVLNTVKLKMKCKIVSGDNEWSCIVTYNSTWVMISTQYIHINCFRSYCSLTKVGLTRRLWPIGLSKPLGGVQKDVRSSRWSGRGNTPLRHVCGIMAKVPWSFPADSTREWTECSAWLWIPMYPTLIFKWDTVWLAHWSEAVRTAASYRWHILLW